MSDDFAQVQQQVAEMDKWHKEARDLEFAGQPSKAKRYMEKAESISREANKAWFVRMQKNKKLS